MPLFLNEFADTLRRPEMVHLEIALDHQGQGEYYRSMISNRGLETQGTQKLVAQHADTTMSDITRPRQPTPKDFGLTGSRLKYFNGVFGELPLAIAGFGVGVAAVCIIGLNWTLPRDLTDSIPLFWRILLPLIPAGYLVAAIHGWRRSSATKQSDFPAFTSYMTALQGHKRTMGTYHYLTQVQRSNATKTRREQSRAKWVGIDGRDFEIEVVKILFSKGYAVTHTGGSGGGDEGVDFVVRFGDKKIIGQCKAHKSYLSAGFVRELYGTLVHQKADEAWLVGTTGFYRGAKAFASDKPIRLLRIEDLLRLPHASALTGSPLLASQRINPFS